jgi:hypothetical protein
LRSFATALFVSAGALIGAFVGARALATPRIYPTGVTIYDPAKSYNSFVCFSAMDGNTHLIDMNGNEVHRWNHAGLPGEIIDPKLIGGKLGHVLLQLTDGEDKRGGIFSNGTVGELDWDGRIIWEWGEHAPGGAARQNHDWARLPNGNTLLLVAMPHAVRGLGPKIIGDQGIYEVSPEGAIVWKWVAGDHLSEFGISPAGMKYLRERIARTPVDIWGYLEINDMQVLGPNKWYDAGDKRFAPENIILDSRKGNFVIIIDRTTGKVVWRLGPDFSDSQFFADQRIVNNSIPRPVDQISGQHDAQLIPEGLPGAGNLLLFDDQGGAGFPPVLLGVYAGSRVLEIDPVQKQIVWQYTGESSGRPPWTFFSSFVSSARRLPNGNTLIDEGMNGRIFQVTPSGEIVWEYLNSHQGPMNFGGKLLPSSMVFRAQPVPYDWVPPGTPHSEVPVS